MGSRWPVSVNLYDPDGQPLGMTDLLVAMGRWPRAGYDGKHLVVAGEIGVLLFDRTCQNPHMLDLPIQSSQEKYWYPYIAAGGKDLLLHEANGRAPVLHRFALP